MKKKIVSAFIGLCCLALAGCGNFYLGVSDADENGVTLKTIYDEEGNVISASDTDDTEEESYNETTGQSKNSSANERDFAIDGLSSKGSGYEGTKGTGNYNYGEALQKSILFYELQRSGELPAETRTNWRGNSCLNDGQDAGLDLTGGWFDAGDNVKFNLPMSYTAAMLGWSMYEDMDSYEESGQKSYALANIKYACDYFIKCHPEDEVYYYQVGDGNQDHSWWGPAELVETRMSRPSYKVTASEPGSAVTGETAAALAVASILFKDEDPAYSKKCLDHAKSLYAFSEKYKSDDGYTAANGFYNSWSGYYDELAWAGVWLYIATEDKSYLDKAEKYYSSAGQDYAWAQCWDDVHIGAAVLLADITDGKVYKDMVEKHLDYWTVGTNGERVTYSPKGLAWCDNWGSLRYATTTAFVASVYSEMECCPKDKVDTYWDFAVSQADYALGSTGRSFMVGFGEDYPVHVHHRTAQGSYSNNMNEPSEARHVLYGALVGGPDASDNYTDEVSNYNNNEVACDYNAGFTGLLAKLYSRYHGQTIKDFGAIEEPGDEIFAEASINVEGQDFIEIKAYVYNESAWPARANSNMELRYFVDLSEVYDAGQTASDIEVTGNYIQNASVGQLVVWDETSHIYYLPVIFEENAVYPGGQEYYKKEIQVRLRNNGGVWDNSNDYSFEGLSNGSMILAEKFALYDNGELVFGSEPKAGEHAGQKVESKGNTGNSNSNSQGSSKTANSGPSKSTAKSGDISIGVEYAQTGSAVNSISGTITIVYEGKDTISLQDLEIDYYFTNEDSADLTFACYYSGYQGADGSYSAIEKVKGSFSDTKDKESDTVCKITFSDKLSISKGDTVSVNFCINHSDWSNMNMNNDYSAKDAANIVIKY